MIVSGLVLTSSDETMSAALAVGLPEALVTKGLGNTPASTVWVPTVSPAGVFGLQPVGLSVVPNEIVPPATPT